MPLERPIAIYIRVSTGKQDLNNQVIAIRKWLELQGETWDSVEYKFQDVETGAEDKRPQFQELWRLIREGRVKSIVVFEISRLSRKQRTLINFLYDSVEKGVMIYSVKESYINDWLRDPKSRTIIVGLLSILYDLERQLIGERTKAGLERVKAMGKHIGRPRKIDNKHKNEIARLYRLGVSISEIARKYKVSPRTIKRRLKEWGIIK